MLDEIGGSWDVDSRSNCDGIHRRADATATADQLGHDAVPVLRNYAAEKRDALHQLRLDARSNETRRTESERRDGHPAQHHSRARSHLKRPSNDGAVHFVFITPP